MEQTVQTKMSEEHIANGIISPNGQPKNIENPGEIAVISSPNDTSNLTVSDTRRDDLKTTSEEVHRDGEIPLQNFVNGTAETDSVEIVDSHGFINGDVHSKIDLEVLRRREQKWLHMSKNWDDFMVHNYKKVRSRCRKGIPPATRPTAWSHLCGAKYMLEGTDGDQSNENIPTFEMLRNHTGDNKWTDDIQKDLHRNFPNHELFGGTYKNIGREELFHVLKAYSLYNPAVGYCQAQAPVAALLLMTMPTEQAFWCFVSICDKYLNGYYSSGMEAIQLDGDILFGLLKKVSPKAYKHLKKQGIDPILYMTEWFLCAFTRTLPWSTVLRIWDMFMCEGVKVLFKVGLVLLKNALTDNARKQCPSMYETLTRLKELPSDITGEEFLVQQVLQLDMSEEVMAKEHRKQLEKRKKNK